MSRILGYDSKFLESTDNLKKIVKKSLGREPNSEVAKGATVCLQQGRLYFEAAEKSPMEIKPLLIFYGIVNYSKGLVIERNFMKIESLPQKHGICDISSQTSKLEGLKVKCEGEGTFQQFNNSVCKLDYIEYKKRNIYEYITIPTAESGSLENNEYTLKDILARMHRLAPLYKATFCEEPKSIRCDISYEDARSGLVKLSIKEEDIINDSQSRGRIINKLKDKYPFLEDWMLIEARGSSDHSVLVFTNLDKISSGNITKNCGYSELENGEYSIGPFYTGLKHGQYKCVNFWEIMQPTGVDPSNDTYLIEPIDGICISELSLYYLGMFLLSSLVRYRPQIWIHSLSHLATSDSPSDDAALALIEKFLEDTINVFPSAIVKAMSMKTNSPSSSEQ